MAEPPFFVVGSPRSGTTLVRTMLDNHPRFAVPKVSYFIIGMLDRRLRLEHRPEAALEAILANPRFLRWEIDPALVRERFDQQQPATFPEVVAAVYETYAEAHHKARWGDKTPLYGLHIPKLATMFPASRFIHVIRDGHDAAASLHNTGTATSVVVGMVWWSRWVTRMRAGGKSVGADRYLEIRYESIVKDPTAAMSDVCDFLGETFEPAMLEYWRTSVPKENEGYQRRFPNLLSPPKKLDRDWRRGISTAQQAAVEAAGGKALRAFGYEADPQPWTAHVRALGYRAVGLARTGPAKAAQRIVKPADRQL